MQNIMSKEVKVGIFAATGVVLFCLSVVLLGGDKFFFTSSYYLKIRVPQAQGLGKGSVVTLTGVPIGNVRSVSFSEGSSEVELTVSIERKLQSRITEGSLASIKTQGALGDKYIYIQPGPANAKPLADGALLETDRTPDFIDVISSKGAEMGEIVEVIKEVRLMFQNINRDNRSEKLMANMVESTAELTKTMNEARETFRYMRNEALPPLASVMKKIDKGQGTLGALINDPSLHNRLSNMLGESPRNNFLKPLIRESIQTNEQKR